jgi:Putative inner membrane exporter, YdcZ
LLKRRARVEPSLPSDGIVFGRRRFYFIQCEVPGVQWLLFPVAVLAGTLMFVQAACNAMLEKIIDRPVTVGVINLSVGLATLVIADIATGQLG